MIDKSSRMEMKTKTDRSTDWDRMRMSMSRIFHDNVAYSLWHVATTTHDVSPGKDGDVEGFSNVYNQHCSLLLESVGDERSKWKGTKF